MNFLGMLNVPNHFEHETGTKEWKEGVDAIKVEPSIICHDGESIQVIN